MSKRKKSKKKGNQQGKRAKATLGGETVEPRILLSATWITGTDNAETVTGTSGDDCLDGLGGDDVLQGNGGDDTLRGGLGDDDLQGGAGNDTADYSQASGGMVVDLGTGTTSGADGNDTLTSIENVIGSKFADDFYGGNGDETLAGGGGDDIISGGYGDDTLLGGDGNDYLYGAYDDDVIDGGAGRDTVDYQAASSSVTVDLTLTGPQDTGGGGIDTLTNIERVVGSTFNDTFAFSNPADGDLYTIHGNGGSNTIDLSNFASAQLTSGRDAIVVDLGGGQSFQINYTNVDAVQTSDVGIDPNTQDPDYKPVADAGGDQTVNEGDLVTLTGVGSSDADGDTLTYQWVQTGGPAVTLDDPNAATPTFTAPNLAADTDLEFTLTVNDGKYSEEASVVVHITATDDAPTANAGSDQLIDGSTLVTLDATGSSDPEGQGLTYTWTQTGGPAVTLSDTGAAQPTFTPTNPVDPTTLTFEVSVSDGTSVTVDTVEVQVNPQGLVGRWDFEGAGQTVTDDSGNGNDGTLGSTGGVNASDPSRVVDPQRGNVLEFDGTQYVSNLGQGPTGDFSLSSWINHSGSGTGWDTLYASGDGGLETWLGVEIATGKIGLTVGGSGNWFNSSAGAITAGSWHHVAGTWDGANAHIYVDGVDLAITPFGSPSDPVAGAGHLGAYDSGGMRNFLEGKLDDVRAYDSALSAADIATMAIPWIEGTTGNDDLTGTAGDDRIRTFDGRDRLEGGTGDDVLDGGAGVDTADYMNAAGGVTVDLAGGTSSGADGADTLIDIEDVEGSSFGDNLVGDAGANTLKGHGGDDSLSGGGGDDDLSGGAGNDALYGEAGDDLLKGRGGDDTIDGGSGTDTVSYNEATSSLAVDLTVSTAQDTGGAGTDTLTNVEGVIGGPFDDTFSFSNPVDGAVYTVDGGGGTNNTIDLSNFVSTDITFGDGTMTIDMGGGQSFQIDHVNVKVIDFGDVTARTITTNTNAASYTGSTIWIDGPQTFRIDTSGAGSIDWGYDVATDTFTLTDTTLTDATTNVVIQDLNGADLAVSTIATDEPLGSLTTNVDIGTIAISTSGGEESIGTITVAGGTGTIGSFTAGGGSLDGTSIINANVTSMSFGANLRGTMSVNGDVGTLTLTQDIEADLTISGDLDTFSAAGVSITSTVLAGQVVGTLDFQVNSVQHGGTYGVPTEFTFSGATQAATTSTVGNTAPVADAGIDQVVNEGDVVTLDATSTSDADGDSLTYTWVQTSGPAVVLSDANATQPTFTAPEGLSNTDFTFELTADDGNGPVATDTVTITINADNDTPTAAAGVDQTVDEGDVVTLDGTASTDPEAQGITYTWVQTSGPAVTLSNANAAQPTFTAPDIGTNTSVSFDLTVSDGNTSSVADSVTINIGTWIEGDGSDNSLVGTAGDDKIRTFGGADSILGGAGQDLLDGGSGNDYLLGDGGDDLLLGQAGDDSLEGASGNDTLDGGDGYDLAKYQTATSAVSIDLTITSAQDTVGAGVDTLTSIEGAVGSTFDDTFAFSNPTDGATYTVDGNGGTNNTIDLSNFASTDVTFGDGTMTIDMGGGQSFQIDYLNVQAIDFGDVTATVLAGSHSEVNWSGSGIYVDGDQAFRVDQSGSGNLDWSYDVATDTLTIDDIDGGNNSTAVVLSDLNGTDLTIDSIAVSSDMNSLTTNVDVGALTINFGTVTIDTTTIAGGAGTIGSFDLITANLVGAWTINADVTSFSLAQDLNGTLTVDGDVGTMAFRYSNNALHVTGSLDSLNATEIRDTLQVDGSMTDLTASLIRTGATTIGGSLTTLNVTDVESDVTIGGDLDTAVIGTVTSGSTVTASNVLGTLDFQVNSVQHGGTYGVPTEFTFSGATQMATVNVAGNTIPVADAGSDQIVDEGDVVTLDATSTSDADGDSLTYTWVQISGPAVALSDANATQPTFTALEDVSNTNVQFELTVDDGNGPVATDTVTITINADDDAPTASAGGDQFVTEGDVVTLSGIASSDPEGQGLTYTWVQTSGPAVVLSDPNAAQPTFTAPEQLSSTSVTFDLQVNDGTSTSSADSVTVNISANNDLPTANAGGDQVVTEGDAVTLTGVASSDPEGQGLTYTWVQTSGPAVVLSDPNAAQPTFTAPEGLSNTDFTFDLQVNDGTNTSSADSVTVTVNADNDAPSADAGIDQVVNEGDLVTLTGVASSDPEAQGLTYTWVQTSGPAVVLSDPNAAQPTFTAPNGVSNTSVTFDLQVNDGTNTSSADSITVTVNATDEAPTADAGVNQLVTEGDVVSLTGAASSDPEGQSLTYTWVQTSGPAVTLTNPTAASPSFTAPEGISNTSIQFELTVSDGSNTSTDTVIIGVQADDDAPTADAGPNRLATEGGQVVLDGRGSSDPEGVGLRYQWQQVGGPTVVLTTTDTPVLVFDAPESIANTQLDFVLTVSDGSTNSTDTVSVFVNADDDAPTVDAGQNQVVRQNDSVQLTATAQDPENQSLTYQWQQVGGPAVVLDDANSTNPTFTAPTTPDGAVLQFAVGVSDGSTTTFDSVSIVIAPNVAPEVSIQGVTSTTAGDFVTVGAAARDADGDALSYRWSQVGGPTVSVPANDAPLLRFVAPEVPAATDLTFQVEVSDGILTTTQVVTISVEPQEQPVVAQAAPAPTPAPEVDSSPSQEEEDDDDRSTTTDISDPAVTSQPAPTPTAPQPTSQVASTSLAEMTAPTNESEFSIAATMSETNTGSEPAQSLNSGEIEFAIESDNDYEQADENYLTRNLLANETDEEGSTTRVDMPDLLVAEAGNELSLMPRIASEVDGAPLENVRWTQVSGTPLALDSVEGSTLRVRLPEVFIEEELVFEVELMRDGQRVVQEVAVQVQPVGLTNRSLSIDDHGPTAAQTAEQDDGDGQNRGFGKIWAAMLAFFGAQTGRKKS